MLLLQRERLRENRVVGTVAGQGGGQVAVELPGLEIEAATRRLLAAWRELGRGQFDAVIDLQLVRVRHQLVEKTADLAHVASGLRQPLLAGVEFFEHGHRDEDVVFLEPEDGRGVVHHDVGVENVDPARFDLLPGLGQVGLR